MSYRIIPDYRILTDATADFVPGMLHDLPRIEVIPMEVSVGDDRFLYGPGGNLSVKQFYDMLRSGKFASTSQINPAAYKKAFESALQNGYGRILMFPRIDGETSSLKPRSKPFPKKQFFISVARPSTGCLSTEVLPYLTEASSAKAYLGAVTMTALIFRSFSTPVTIQSPSTSGTSAMAGGITLPFKVPV